MKQRINEDVCIGISDVDLKDVKEHIQNDIGKHMITIMLKNTSSIPASTWTKLTDCKVYNSIGDGSKLSYSNGEIIIGDGVNKVLVSGTCRAIKSTNNLKVFQFSIGRTVGEFTQLVNTPSQSMNVSISPILVNVSKNDRFKMQITNNGEFQAMADGDTLRTYMTVEVVS